MFSGGAGGEYVEALSQVIGTPGGGESNPPGKAPAASEEPSQLDAAANALVAKAPDSINLSQDDVQKLQREDSAQQKKEKRHSVSSGSKLKSGKSKENEKDSVLFTCGHHFTQKEFKVKNFCLFSMFIFDVF